MYPTIAHLPVHSPRRRIFVSYHHAWDQVYYNEFANACGADWEAVHDRSLRNAVDSDDLQYVYRRVREVNLTGTSCTIVLCGPNTRWRKFVDWEIKATLDKKHSLIGVKLPTNLVDEFGRYHKPDRLQDNINSGYALWIHWEQLYHGPCFLRQLIERGSAKPKSLIDNRRPLRKRNGSQLPNPFASLAAWTQ